MIYEPAVRNFIKNSDLVESNYLVVAEWNMNRYQRIEKYGLYSGTATSHNTPEAYSSSDPDIKSGKLYHVYDDGTLKENVDAQIFSSLASVFQPDRPDPGIVLTTFNQDTVITKNSGIMRIGQINSSSARFYPFSRNRTYDYFNSGRIIDIDGISDGESTINTKAKSAPLNGAIEHCNPFVVYENSFPSNKIVIKIQNHSCIPDNYYVDIYNESTTNWENVYHGTTASGFVDGILELYYDGTSTWTQTVHRVTDLDEISNPTSELKLIKGIRLRVQSLSTITSQNVLKSGTLELIEISPRIEIDLTTYTENFSMSSTIGDSELGLPIGSLVTSTGNISFSNETGEFLLSSSAAAYKMLTPDVEFRMYQNITVPGSPDTTYTVPLKVLYADEWSVQPDFSVDIRMSDKMKLLQDMNVADLAFISDKGTPFSAIILMVLDNAGITGYEFKTFDKTSPKNEDTRIKTFFCKKEQTVTEVLEKIAVATQSAMFFDATNKLNVLTKERITGAVKSNVESTNTVTGTDYWIVYDEDYAGQSESAVLSGSYTANVISSVENKIDPVTDGTITYHSYGVRRKAGQALINSGIPLETIGDLPYTIATNTGYDPVFSILWSPDQGGESVLGAATLLKDISITRLENISALTSPTYSASYQEDAVRQIYSAATEQQKKSFYIELDRSDILTFTNFKGYVMIDQEIISYNGKVFSVNGRDRIFFSQEEIDQVINNLSSSARNSSIIPKGLIVDIRFNVSGYDDADTNLYKYKIKSTGRGELGTRVTEHKKDNTLITNSEIESFTLGAKNINKAQDTKSVLVTTKYSYDDVTSLKKVKRIVGLRDAELFNTYYGLLKICGPKAPLEDRRAANSDSSVEIQNRINKEDVDAIVRGNFDPFMYTLGERNIYMVPINDFNFKPNLVSTRMKLFSGRKQLKSGNYKFSTNSSIAGIGFALKKQSGKIVSGYFLEIESKGSAAQDFDKQSKDRLKNNIRFYKVTKQGAEDRLQPELLGAAQANIITSAEIDFRNIDVQNKDTEMIADLEIRINYKKDDPNVKFSIYYGGKKIIFNTKNGDISDKTTGDLWGSDPNVFMFVRNDSQAVFEYVLVAQRPSKTELADEYFNNKQKVEFSTDYDLYLKGTLNPNLQNMFKDSKINARYYDFSRTVREVKKYVIRYDTPAISSKIIDISSVNPKYMIYGNPSLTSYGGDVVVVNASKEPITISQDSNLPLYIYGTRIEQLSTGNVNLKDFYGKIDADGEKNTDLSFNTSIYGNRTFNIDSELIQNIDQSTRMLKWIISNCSRQRMSIKLEIFANPLLELGDKIKIFSKERGYYKNNPVFKEKTFIVSEITYAVDGKSSKMNLALVEVGEQ